MKRFYHAVFNYRCSTCGSIASMAVEKGLEERCNPKLKEPSGLPHKPTPFNIACPYCRKGFMFHVSTIWLDHFEEVRKGDSLFMNTKKSDCGKPVFRWGGE